MESTGKLRFTLKRKPQTTRKRKGSSFWSILKGFEMLFIYWIFIRAIFTYNEYPSDYLVAFDLCLGLKAQIIIAGGLRIAIWLHDNWRDIVPR